MGEDGTSRSGRARDRAATRRDVDAGIRDRLADEEMTESEHAARAAAARDRMPAMQDRQAAAQERDEPLRRGAPDPREPDA